MLPATEKYIKSSYKVHPSLPTPVVDVVAVVTAGSVEATTTFAAQLFVGRWNSQPLVTMQSFRREIALHSRGWHALITLLNAHALLATQLFRLMPVQTLSVVVTGGRVVGGGVVGADCVVVVVAVAVVAVAAVGVVVVVTTATVVAATVLVVAASAAVVVVTEVDTSPDDDSTDPESPEPDPPDPDDAPE
jgi:hypothetical protein